MSFFKQRKSGTPASAKGDIPAGAPVVVRDREASARIAWFERYAHPSLAKNQMFVALMMVSAVAVMEGIALINLFPYVKPIPYVIKVNESTGKVESQIVKATDLTLDVPEKQYFLAQFALKLMEIDRAKSRDNFKEIAGMVIDKASGELTDFRTTTQLFVRLAQTPNLTRVGQIKTVTLLPAGDAALIRITTDETLDSASPIRKAWLITVHYKVIPPASEDEIYRNPLGIYITHFAVQEDAE